jgi:hypothetical protein
LQRLGDSSRDLTLNSSDVSQLAVVGVYPDVGVGLRANQLHVDPHLIGFSSYAAFKYVRYAELLRNVVKIP